MFSSKLDTFLSRIDPENALYAETCEALTEDACTTSDVDCTDTAKSLLI